MEGRLKGVPDNMPPARSQESIRDEVLVNQSRLTHAFKTWRMKDEGIDRYFGLSLTIGPNGDVQKVALKGIANKVFRAEVEAIIKTWAFSPVREKRSVTANLKNLDFMHRRELVVE
jgi:hypothetical protein